MAQFNVKGFSDLVKNFFAARPSEVDGIGNISAWYWQRKLFRWAMKIFEVPEAPEHWDMPYFWEHLFQSGHIGITDTTVGVIPLKCGYTGINVFDHPTTLTFANNVLGNFEREIGIDCAFVHLQYDFTGVMEMIDRYSYFFAAIDSAMSVNLLNTHTAWMAEAESKAQADSLKAMYDQIAMGKPAVFFRSDKTGDGAKFNVMNVTNTFITDKLQMCQRMFLNMFLSEWGVPNFNSEKKARLNSEEVHGNDVEVLLNTQDWTDNIQRGFDEANRLFGLNLHLKVRTREELLRIFNMDNSVAGANVEDDTQGMGDTEGGL